MTADEFELAKPIVEGYLYAYANMVRIYPGAPVSSAYSRLREYGTQQPGGGGERSSPQERHVEKYGYEIQLASRIEMVLYRLTARDIGREGVDRLRWWRIAYLHYAERWPWPKVADEMHVDKATIYRWKDKLLWHIAEEFDLVTAKVG